MQCNCGWSLSGQRTLAVMKLRKNKFKGVGHRVQHHHLVLKNTSFQHLIIQVIDMNSVVPP